MKNNMIDINKCEKCGLIMTPPDVILMDEKSCDCVKEFKPIDEMQAMNEYVKDIFPTCKECGKVRPPEDVILFSVDTCGCDRTQERKDINKAFRLYIKEKYGIEK